MFNSWISAFLLTFSLAFTSVAQAANLPDFIELAEKHGAEVVNISVTQTIQIPDNTIPLPVVPGGPPPSEGGQEYKAQSTGSGFIISADGYILTNAHVVDHAEDVLVTLNDKREFKAKIIGADKRTDVALIKIDTTNLPKATIGDPALLKVGEWVAAIGSPFGLENTMTAGIVSAKGRALPQDNFVPFIQTDVAINPGNSGGPLYNLRGEVVGVNSQIFTRAGGGSLGLSFSIPIDMAINISNELKTNGRIIRGWLGIAAQELTKELAESFGIKNSYGALIAGVEKSGPAEKAGILVGDVITKFDNRAVINSNDLSKAVAATKPGKAVPVEILRKGAVKTLSISLGEMPSDSIEPVTVNKPAPKITANKIGLTLKEPAPALKKKLNGKPGLFVTDSTGSSAQAGIRRGDVILSLNNIIVQNVDQVNKQINAVLAGQTIAALVMRADGTLYVPIKVTK